jgi:hypothetical protein
LEGIYGCPTNPPVGKKEVRLVVELRTLEDLIWEVERGARKIITQLGPYAVQVYRVKLAGGPVIRVDLRRTRREKDGR